jgi:hypothetical protein
MIKTNNKTDFIFVKYVLYDKKVFHNYFIKKNKNVISNLNNPNQLQIRIFQIFVFIFIFIKNSF